MATSPISPRLTKGAFVEFSNRFGSSWVPNVIMFQYNPASMTRSLEGWKEDTENEKSSNEGATAQPFDPGETLDFKLELDAADVLDNPLRHPLAAVAGVTDRIAAIEMLLYPQQDTTLKGLLKSTALTLGGALVGTAATGFLTGSLGAAAGIGTQFGFDQANAITKLPVPRGTVPTVLFAWSTGRIVPVRIMSFSVDEQAYNPNLYVHRATISIKLKIIAPRNIPCSKTEADKKAATAYNIYQQQKRDYAALNMVNQVFDTGEEWARRGIDISKNGF